MRPTPLTVMYAGTIVAVYIYIYFFFRCRIDIFVAIYIFFIAIYIFFVAVYRRVARTFFVGGGGGAYLKNRDQIMNVLNDTLC